MEHVIQQARAQLVASGPSLALALVLPPLLLVAWRLRAHPAQQRSTGPSSLDYVCLAGTSLLVCALVRLPFALYLERHVADPALWVGPLDRLFATMAIVATGLALTGSVGARRWRLAMVAMLAVATVVWSAWAPVWANELAMQQPRAADPTGVAYLWDMTLVGLSLGMVGVLRLRSQRPPPWVMALPVLFAVGALLEAVRPVAIDAAVWLRSGELAAVTLLGAVVLRAARAHDGPAQHRGAQHRGLRGSAKAAGERLRRLAGSARGGATGERPVGTLRHLAVPPARRHDTSIRRTAIPVGPQARADAVASHEAHGTALPANGTGDLETAAVVHDALEALVNVGASPAVLLLRRGDDLETWARMPPAPARRVGRLPLAGQKTVGRAMTSGSLSLEASDLNRDVDELYGLLGVPHVGPVLVEPIGHPARGALLAGRAYGPWQGQKRERIARIAHQLDQRLGAIERHWGGDGTVPRILGALESQSAALTRLSRQLDGLTGRVDLLEHRSEIEQVDDGGHDAASAGSSAETAGTSAASRGSNAPVPGPHPQRPAPAPGLRTLHAAMSAYERALRRVPWGVLICDPRGIVRVTNDGARSMLGSQAAIGKPLAQIAPEIATELESRLRHLRQSSGPAQEPAASPERLLLEAHDAVLELEPLWSPGIGLLGVMVVCTPSEGLASVGAPELHADRHTNVSTHGEHLVPMLIDALREPMRTMMAHQDVMTRRSGFVEPELERHMAVVDAHLSRLDIRLTDLMTALELSAGQYRLATGPIDVAEQIEAAVERAEPQLAEKSLRTILDVPDDLPPAYADRRALGQVLDNLLASAVDRSPHGAPVRLRAALRDLSGRHAPPEGGPMLVITVQFHDLRHRDVAGRVFAIGDSDGPALRVARLLTEVQGGRAWGEHLDNPDRMVLSIGLPELSSESESAAEH